MKKLICLLILIISIPAYGWMSTAIIGGGTPTGGGASNQFVEPNGDTSVGNWQDEGSGTADIYTSFDDATHPPSGSPGVDDYIVSTNSSDLYSGTMDGSGVSGIVSSFEIHINGMNSGNDAVDVDVSDDGSTWEGYQALSMSSSHGWNSTTFTGLSWSSPSTIYYRIRTQTRPRQWTYVAEATGEINP